MLLLERGVFGTVFFYLATGFQQVPTCNLIGETQAISCHEGVRFEVHMDCPAVAVEVWWMTI